eukprot:COSAG02_NODE_26843_length_622_cov_2.745698_1_plen_171_part_00
MGFSRVGIGVFVVAALGFLSVGIGGFVVAALGFLGEGIGVFVVAALVFLGVGIGVFVVAALVFLWSRHWCFCAPAPLFFSGKKPASRAEKPKNADAWETGRDGQAKGPVHARMPTSISTTIDSVRSRSTSIGGAAVQRIQADQPAAAARHRRCSGKKSFFPVFGLKFCDM